jgi:hypothetical protein
MRRASDQHATVVVDRELGRHKTLAVVFAAESS